MIYFRTMPKDWYMNNEEEETAVRSASPFSQKAVPVFTITKEEALKGVNLSEKRREAFGKNEGQALRSDKPYICYGYLCIGWASVINEIPSKEVWSSEPFSITQDDVNKGYLEIYWDGPPVEYNGRKYFLDSTNNEFAFVLEDLSKEEGNDRIVGAVTSIDDIESNAFFRHGRPYYKLGTATSSYKDGVGFTSYHVAGLAEDIYYMLFKRSAGYCTDAISMDAISGDGQILLDIAAQCSRSEVIGTPIYAGSTKPFELTELNVKFADANGKPFKDYYGNSIAEGGEFILLMYAVAKDPDVRTLPWGVRDGHVYAGIIDIPAATVMLLT